MRQYVANAPHPLYRIDGAWFVCLDGKLAPRQDDCHVLSFGVNRDYTFDKAMTTNYGCHVYSFDPLIEDTLFANIRSSDPRLVFSVVLNVTDKWKFYKLGVAGKNSFIEALDWTRLGSKHDLNSILKLTGLKNKVVDILKMDIEGDEKEVFVS